MATITYQDKEALYEEASIADINKVTDDNMNEIKRVVNTNDDNIGNLTNLQTTDNSNIVNAINSLVPSNLFVVEQVVVDNLEIAAQGFLSNATDCTKLGYTPLGVVGFRISNASTSGAGSSRAFFQRCVVSPLNNNISYQLGNYYSGTIRILIGVDVLYIKTS